GLAAGRLAIGGLHMFEGPQYRPMTPRHPDPTARALPMHVPPPRRFRPRLLLSATIVAALLGAALGVSGKSHALIEQGRSLAGFGEPGAVFPVPGKPGPNPPAPAPAPADHGTTARCAWTRPAGVPSH